ncbi:hypothetical protein CR492_07595 [Methylocella silvestris]|uniref:Uncharacterized protein n=2 Tax=Methylocella silvestris TaxID=199596 RepID=A0A2J7TII5_METSI|nr:hypothetical protein CR492_07595 [Methylocella silvestris]
MGELLAFKLPARKSRISRPSKSGEILFFTGVRREVMAETANFRRRKASPHEEAIAAAASSRHGETHAQS